MFETIFEHATTRGRVFDVVLFVMIAASIVIVSLESVEAVRARHGALLWALEYSVTGLFTLEYAARLYSHPRPSVYARSFFGVVDLVSILPTWIGLLVPGAQAFVLLRTLRLLRIFRVLKLARFVSEGNVLARALRASGPKIAVFLITVLCTVTVCGAAMYSIEGPGTAFTSIPTGIYWAIVTLTTVGFGDVTPSTPAGQFLASLIMILGYGIVAVPTGIVSAELVRSGRALSGEVCAQCGLEEHDTDARFCKRCGTDLAA